ncbi:histidinol-phosphate phosphatase [Leptotrichia shahii]|uniref:D,D-heptose 1,7-bisphosphate phosphatase n=1 Tax=Leptotrichia shahii TaxID=157691 RepID=A0A510JKK0_9FUSO|nr:HAD family hydrolase [Leptotrichia shahii]BBM39832.1 histidinol-phosphate phosphatase [Leptotrichia shahii]
MKNKFVLLDRDGVINIEKSYLHKIEDFEYEKNVVEGLLRLRDLGYRFAIITNQAGIARGYYTEEDYLKLQSFIEDDLFKKGIKIEKSYFCPHHPNVTGKYGIECDCRKPNTGNFELAIKEFDIDVKNSFMIGDKITDLIPAEKLGITPVLVKTGYGLESLKKLEGTKLNSIVVNDILDFSEVLKNMRN